MVQKIDISKKKDLQKIIIRNHPILFSDNFYNLIQLFYENREIKIKLASVTQQLENIKKSRTYKISKIMAKPIIYLKYKFLK